LPGARAPQAYGIQQAMDSPRALETMGEPYTIEEQVRDIYDYEHSQNLDALYAWMIKTKMSL
jgi:hypothetical protein